MSVLIASVVAVIAVTAIAYTKRSSLARKRLITNSTYHRTDVPEDRC